MTALNFGMTPDQACTSAYVWLYVWLEAEAGALSQAMQPNERAASEAERYVEAVAREQRLEAPPEGRSSTYPFRVPQSGAYVIWGRVFSLSEGSNSLWVRVDEGRWRRWNNMSTIGAWTWDPVSSGAGDEIAEPEVFSLKAGRHLLRIRNREDGTQLDHLIITNGPLTDRTLPKGKGNKDTDEQNADMVPINGT